MKKKIKQNCKMTLRTASAEYRIKTRGAPYIIKTLDYIENYVKYPPYEDFVSVVKKYKKSLGGYTK